MFINLIDENLDEKLNNYVPHEDFLKVSNETLVESLVIKRMQSNLAISLGNFLTPVHSFMLRSTFSNYLGLTFNKETLKWEEYIGITKSAVTKCLKNTGTMSYSGNYVDADLDLPLETKSAWRILLGTFPFFVLETN